VLFALGVAYANPVRLIIPFIKGFDHVTNVAKSRQLPRYQALLQLRPIR
jgi:hypothetical protein